MNTLGLQKAGIRSRWYPAGDQQAATRSEGAGYLLEGLNFLGEAYGGVLMIGSPWAGLILMGSLAIEPQHLFGAMIGLLTGEGCRKLIGTEDLAPIANIRANAILSGIAASWLAAPAAQPLYVVFLLVFFSSGAAALVSAALSRAMVLSPAPPLIAAFAIVFSILLTLFPQWTLPAVASEGLWPYPVGFAGWLDSALRSLGMVVFSPRPETGALVLLALLLWSRLAFLHGAVGWVAGIFQSKLLAGLGFKWLWLVSAHNSFVAGMLLGAVFYLPGRAGLVASAMAGASASILALFMQTGLSGSAWAFQPLPALATVWIGLFALAGRHVQHGLVANFRREIPPEQAWRLWHLGLTRFGAPQALLTIPLAGAVTISQGFDGSLSHRGLWRHGLDFVGATTPEVAVGTIFGAPVYCPAAGVVEQLCDDIGDNPIGISNYSQNWGNHLVLRMDQGGWLMLAHLARGSISVTVGQRVVIGQIVASVGNSGRSPLPHLHMHVQHGPLPGTPTLAFRLANYLLGAGNASTWIGSGVPNAGTVLRAALPIATTLQTASSLAPGLGHWHLRTEGTLPARYAHAPQSMKLVTTLDPDGNHRISDASGGRLLLRADPDALRVHALDSGVSLLLRIWALGLPVLPYCAAPGLTWRDEIEMPADSWKESVLATLAPYADKHSTVIHMTCRKISDDNGAEMVVEADLANLPKNEPIQILCRIAALKGPVAFEAKFKTGSIVIELIAFEPGLPDGT